MKKIHFTRKTVLLVILAVLVLGGGGVFAYVEFRDDSGNTASQDNEADEGMKINYGPPTEEERRAGDEKKQEIVEEQQRQSGQPTEATVVISDAGYYDNQIEVRAFVSNMIEAGTCTITFTHGDTNIKKQVVAFKDASTTQCTALNVPRSQFPTGGTWTVKVAYKSAHGSGEAQKEIEL